MERIGSLMNTANTDNCSSPRTQVRVFKNLTRKCYSVQVKGDGGWRTYVHANNIVLQDVSFLVYEKSRLRILETGKKTVHAFAVGYCSFYDGNIVKPLGFHLENNEVQMYNKRRVRYNPHKGPWFFFENGLKVDNLEFLNMQKDGLYEAYPLK